MMVVVDGIDGYEEYVFDAERLGCYMLMDVR